MIRITKEGRDRLVRYIRNPTKEELENRERLLDGVEERVANRVEIEKELVMSLKKIR